MGQKDKKDKDKGKKDRDKFLGPPKQTDKKPVKKPQHEEEKTETR